MVTPTDLAILPLLAHYYVLTRAQFGRLAFPDDDDGRSTRRHLQKLLALHFIRRTRMEVVNPAMGAPAPVYHLSDDGAAYLAEQMHDDRFNTCCTQIPNWQHLYHWCAVSEFHILLDRAAARSRDVTVARWYGEWDVLDPKAAKPEERYRLFTRLNDRLVCVPDAGFALARSGQQRAFYLELDRHTTMNSERVAAQKQGGYAGLMAERHNGLLGHLRHFPDANPEKFNVLMVAPTAARRDALKRAMMPRPGAQLWRFASQHELNEESSLTGTIWHSTQGEPTALVKS